MAKKQYVKTEAESGIIFSFLLNLSFPNWKKKFCYRFSCRAAGFTHRVHCAKESKPAARQACVNIMYTTHRSIHLVPMKYREWAGHSASLTSLYSTIRLSAIMSHHHPSGKLYLGCIPNQIRCGLASVGTIWKVLNLLIKCEVQRGRQAASHTSTFCLIWEPYPWHIMCYIY